MKGKGKKERDVNDNEDNSCPLQFIDFEPIDHLRQCPRFSTVIQRNEDESIGSEDLDVLQLELETLLVSVVKRQRLLETEMEAMVNWCESKGRDKRSPNKPVSDMIGKRSKHSEERPNKKFKDNQSNSTGSSCSSSSGSVGKSHNSRPQKVKNSAVKFTETDFCEPQEKVVSNKLVVKNDIPNQFWQFIEPFCCEITSEHIKFLTENMKTYENDSEFHKIPNLGKHYSIKWDDNNDNNIDLKDKKKGLSASNCTGSSSMTQSTNKMKKGSKNHSDTDKTSFGALTQRLVSCLIEENLLNGGLIDSKTSNDSKIGPKGSPKANSNGSPNHKVFKSLNLGNTAQLERRIRKELEEHGIISLDDILNGSDTSASDEDEILQELKRCQQELKDLNARNQTQLKRLLSSSKKEMTRQEVRKKLDNADSEVTEAYRRICSAKLKKRSPTKKERDIANKALKDREVILKQLDNLS